jgi:hypothetical protein
MGFVRWLVVDLRAALGSRRAAHVEERSAVESVNDELSRFVSLVDPVAEELVRTARYRRRIGEPVN